MFTTPYTKEAVGQMVQELRRELGMREVVYPGLIARGKLTPTLADQRTNALRNASYLLGALLKRHELSGDILGQTDMAVTIQGRDLNEP